MATENESTMSEDDIDKLKIPRAISLCKKHEINIEDKPKLQQMKWRLKRDLLCTGARRQETIESLDWHANIDEKRRTDLIDIYNNTINNIEYIMKMNDPVVEELKKCYPDICKVLENEKMKISESKAPILVLGETGCGKSSFINLLLGKQILPCSLLSNTHVICEIRSSNHENSFAILDNNDGELKRIEGDPDNYKAFTTELAVDIQAVEDGKPKYKVARICIPSDILKSGVVIVDSPGVGESKEMENMVLDYILNACTFIYIIDSTSAGGMQDRMQKLVQKVYKKALDEQKEYRPDSAIFVCNKWDEVPFNEREEVWEDTKRKIMACWPDCKDTQIYKFSTHEAAYIQDRDGMSPKFKPILEQISQLVPLGREILLMRAYKFLDDFACHCIHCFGTHLNQLKLSAEERVEMREDTKKRLHMISTNLHSFFKDQNTKLEKEIKDIAKALGEYLLEPANMKTVCSFDDSEIPQKTNWTEQAVAVRAIVYEKIMEKIKEWEKKAEKFKHIGENIAATIEKEFPKFEAEIFKVQQKMSKSDERERAGIQDEDDPNLVPNFIKNKFKGLNFGMKVAVGIGLAPVLVVSLVVNLPVFGFKTLQRTYQTYKFESEFKKVNDQQKIKIICQKYANEIVTSITDKLSLEKIIKEDMQQVFKYLEQQQQKMERQIESDLNLLKTLKEEERSDGDITKTYEPLQAKFKILSNRLRHFLFLYLPERYATSCIPYYDLIKSETFVCSGYWADVFHGQSKKPEMTRGEKSISIRITKRKMETSQVKKHIIEQQAYSTIREKSIVQCFGVSTNERFHYQILEPLKCSLRDYLPDLRDDLERHRPRVVLEIARDIVEGLVYLHDREKRLVSLDLSLHTVAVDMSGNIKLTNISLERRVLLEPDYQMGKIDVEKYKHFHPCFFNYTSETRSRKKINKHSIPVPSPVKNEESTGLSSTAGSSSGGISCKQEIPPDEDPADENLTDGGVCSRKIPGQSSTMPRSVSSPVDVRSIGQPTKKRHTSLPASSNLLSDDFRDDYTTLYNRTQQDGHAISCSTDTAFTCRSQHTYTTKDDMYAVGILICNLWHKNLQHHVTQEKDIPVEAVVAASKGDQYVACDLMEKFMGQFQPDYLSPTDVSQMHEHDKDYKDFNEQWWSVISRCLERKMSAREWLDLRKQISHEPKPSLVFNERHYATSPLN